MNFTVFSIFFWILSLSLKALTDTFLKDLQYYCQTQFSCLDEGDRIPAIFTNKHGYVHITMAIGNNGNTYKDLHLSEKRWYKLELEQRYEPTKYTDTITTSTVSII